MGAEIEKNKVNTVTPCPISALFLLKLSPMAGINPATIYASMPKANIPMVKTHTFFHHHSTL